MKTDRYYGADEKTAIKQDFSLIEKAKSGSAVRSRSDSHLRIQRAIGNQRFQLLSNSVQPEIKIDDSKNNYDQESYRLFDPKIPNADNDQPKKQESYRDKGITSFFTPIIPNINNYVIRRVVWEPKETVNENKHPFPDRWDIVGTDSLNSSDITIWKPHKGDTYWCHGFTFGGHEAPDGPYSAYGQDVPAILDQDSWTAIPSCHARSETNDILVFYDYSRQKVLHTGIVRNIELKLKSERFCNNPMLRLVIDNLLTLRKGLRGPQINKAVQEIQEALQELGYELPVYGADGLFGDETRSAICDYQMDRSLSYDGQIGPETLGSLDSEPQFLKSGLIDEKQSTIESKWGWGPLNTSSWLRNAGYGKYTCYSQYPIMEPPGAKADFEF